MSENLGQPEQVTYVPTDSWHFETPETGKLLRAEGNSCVITIIHFPGRVTYLGHYSIADPQVKKPEFSGTEVQRTLRGMVDLINTQASKKLINLAAARAYVLGGSSTDALDHTDPDFSKLLQENFDYSLDSLQTLGLTEDQIVPQRLPNDKDFIITADPLTGEVTQQITPTASE